MKLLFSCLLIAPVMMGGQMGVYAPSRLGSVHLLHDGSNFWVEKNGVGRQVQRCFVDKEIRNLSADKLAKYLAASNYLELNQGSNGEYIVHSHGRLAGGGPVVAGFLYWVSKCTMYASLVSAAGATVAATGGAAAAGAGAMLTTGAAGALGGGAAAGLTGAAIGGAVASSTAATGAVAGAAAATSIAGGAAAVVAGIESVSLAAFAFGMALPLP